MEKLIYEKQLNALKKMKEDEKKDYEEQIEKLELELAQIKTQALNKQYETDSLLGKRLIASTISDFSSINSTASSGVWSSALI